MGEKPSYDALEKRVAFLEQEREQVRSELVKYQTLFHHFPHGITISDSDGKIMETNAAAEKLLGVDKSEHEKRTLAGEQWRIIRPDGSTMPPEEWASVIALKEKRPVFNHEMGIVKSGEEVSWINVSAAPIPSEKGGVIITYSDVSEKKQAQEALREKEQFLETIYTGIAHSIFVVDISESGEFTYAGLNPRHEMLTGISNEEIIGKSPEKVLPQTAARRVREKYEACLRLKQTISYEEWLPFEGKQTCWETILTPQRDSSGAVTRIIGSSLEITERKQMETERKNYENALLDKTTELEQILSAIPDALVYADTDRRIIRVNDSFVKTFGYEPREVLGKTTEILYASPEDFLRQGRERYNEDAGRTLEPYYLEYRRKNGEVFPTESVGTTVHDTGKRVIGLLGLVRDISHTKRAEQVLLETKQKYQSMVENIGIGVSMIAKDMKIIEMNRQMRKWFPNIDTSTAPLCYQAFNDPPFDSPCRWCPTILTLRDGEVHESLTDTPGESGIRHYRIVSSPIVNGEGEVVAAIEMVDDMTERLKFENQIRQAQRMESIGDLAGGIAHDFNNILFPIVGMAELLLEDLAVGCPERESAEEILRAGLRGSDLVKQILAFSRQSEHQMAPTRIQNILKEVLKLSRATIPAYIEIRQDIQNDCGMIRADATQIHQVAMNIITNAYHAMEKQGGKLTVQLRETRLKEADEGPISLPPGRYALLSITDTGHGMSAELIEKIFDPYFTTKEQGKGTGLGLAVVHGIIKEHNGDIRVTSEIGKGSTFRVYLPLMDKPGNRGAGDRTIELKTGHERILLVDDEEPIAKLEKQILERLGYQVTMVDTSLGALEFFKANPREIDLIISDMSMPNLSGDELTARIKSIRPDIPVIICTGFSDRIKDKTPEELGISGILMKPIIKSDLARMVREILDQVRDS